MFKVLTAVSLGFVAHAALAAESPRPPAEPESVVSALLDHPPRLLSELEAVIGPLQRDRDQWEQAVGPITRAHPSLAVAEATVFFDIDVYHQHPEKVEDPGLSRWELRFAAGERVSRWLLEKVYPETKPLEREGEAVERFGAFYLLPGGTDDAFVLAWYDSEPKFAIPRRTAAESARLLEALAAVAEAGFSRAAVEKHFGVLSYDKGWNQDEVKGETWHLKFKPAGAPLARELVVSFKRPLAGSSLLPRLGIPVWRVTSPDVHLQSRSIDEWPTRLHPETGYPMPAFKGYVLDIEVDEEGLVKTNEESPGSPVWRAEEPLIRSFHAFLPRF